MIEPTQREKKLLDKYVRLKIESRSWLRLEVAFIGLGFIAVIAALFIGNTTHSWILLAISWVCLLIEGFYVGPKTQKLVNKFRDTAEELLDIAESRYNTNDLTNNE